MKVYLASASPRRKELLEQIGLTFTVMPAEGEEVITSSCPWEVVQELSAQKAQEIYDKLAKNSGKSESEEYLVIGADTVVAYEERILGKPKNQADAMAMLQMLEGDAHHVYTGVTVILWQNQKMQKLTFYEDTKVCMYPMTKEQIQAYVETGEPMDKAGSYAIQGKCAIFIKEIHGDYNNVVGLPVAGLYQKMLKVGIDIYSIS